MVLHLVEAVERSVAERNWYAALALTLTLPDVCGALEDEGAPSKSRAVKWWDAFMTPLYTSEISGWLPPEYEHARVHVQLGGKDAYALRCAVLHEGSDVTGDRQSAAKALGWFVFTTPSQGGGICHRNQVGRTLQLQVDLFCLEVCDAVRRWVAIVGTEPEIAARIESMMTILDSDDPGGVSWAGRF